MFSIGSIVGTASGHNCLFIFKDFAISAFTVYAELAKCVEHSTEHFWIVNFAQMQSTYLASPFLSQENDASKHRLYVDCFYSFSRSAIQQHNTLLLIRAVLEFAQRLVHLLMRIHYDMLFLVVLVILKIKNVFIFILDNFGRYIFEFYVPLINNVK